METGTTVNPSLLRLNEARAKLNRARISGLPYEQLRALEARRREAYAAWLAELNAHTTVANSGVEPYSWASR